MFDARNKDTLREVLDAVQLPAFAIDVVAADTFELSGINETHEAVSGMQYDKVIGLRPCAEISWFTSLVPILNEDDETVRLIGNAVGFQTRDGMPLMGHVLNDLDYLSAESAIPIYKALELVRHRLDDASARSADRRYLSAFRDLCQTALSGSNRLRSVFTYLRAENVKCQPY